MVTVLHRGTRPLNNFDPYLVDILLQRTRDLGIEVRLQTKVDGIESSKATNNMNNRLVVHASTTDGEKYKVETEMVVHGAGRVPEIDDLELAEQAYDARTRRV